MVHYSIQGNHVHAIVEAAGTAELARGMKSLGSRLARAVNRVFGRSGPVLAERFHLRTLRTPREVRNAIAYVLLNARRHAARLRGFRREVARIDPASSGRWFDAWKRRIQPPTDAPAVAKPRTWLLRIGWRRWGLVDPAEVPGAGGDGAHRAPTRRQSARSSSVEIALRSAAAQGLLTEA